MEKVKVLIGLSGGVDSAVAAYLLKEKGYDVFGVFMKNYSDTKNPLTGECSYLEDKRMAQKIAAKLKIPLKIIDYEKQYKKEVIEPLIEGYRKGITPNPDTSCNSLIKFPALFKEAKKIGAKYVATGHYAKIKKAKSGFELHRGLDSEKDQSYFLYELKSKNLEKILFPLGSLKKDQTRALAKKIKLPNWNRPGTKGICFVGKVDFKKILEHKLKQKPGPVFSPEGDKIGEHKGNMFFTIGERIGTKYGIEITKEYQRKNPGKIYIADKKGNKLIVAPKGHKALKKSKIKVKNLSLVNSKEKIPKNLKARIRHLGPLIACTFNKKISTLKKAQEAIAPGQAIVFYSGTKLVGGGIIYT